jgi:hypothetical protein
MWYYANKILMCSLWWKDHIRLTEFTNQEVEVFEFLDDLRDSGVTNMFGARPYIQEEYSELSSSEAGDLLTKWMSTFEERHPEGD